MVSERWGLLSSLSSGDTEWSDSGTAMLKLGCGVEAKVGALIQTQLTVASEASRNLVLAPLADGALTLV